MLEEKNEKHLVLTVPRVVNQGNIFCRVSVSQKIYNKLFTEENQRGLQNFVVVLCFYVSLQKNTPHYMLKKTNPKI